MLAGKHCDGLSLMESLHWRLTYLVWLFADHRQMVFSPLSCPNVITACAFLVTGALGPRQITQPYPCLTAHPNRTPVKQKTKELKRIQAEDVGLL
jgi:hypothetical protein